MINQLGIFMKFYIHSLAKDRFDCLLIIILAFLPYHLVAQRKNISIPVYPRMKVHYQAIGILWTSPYFSKRTINVIRFVR